MPIDPRKRQKKLERRKAKEKSKAIAERKRAVALVNKTLDAISTAPILHCYRSESIFEEGMGEVLICRSLPHNQVAFGMFLLDLYCMGVKNAMFEIATLVRYEQNLLNKLRARNPLAAIDPASARKLVEGAVDYALSLGIPPHPDYEDAQRVLGDIDASVSNELFVYGKDGKPFYIAGPRDSFEKSKQIVQMLHARLGEGGYVYLVPVAGDDYVPLPDKPVRLNIGADE